VNDCVDIMKKVRGSNRDIGNTRQKRVSC